jgi:hypothetical protein
MDDHREAQRAALEAQAEEWHARWLREHGPPEDCAGCDPDGDPICGYCEHVVREETLAALYAPGSTSSHGEACEACAPVVVLDPKWQAEDAELEAIERQFRAELAARGLGPPRGFDFLGGRNLMGHLRPAGSAAFLLPPVLHRFLRGGVLGFLDLLARRVRPGLVTSRPRSWAWRRLVGACVDHGPGLAGLSNRRSSRERA